jgi:hypothetical protein
MVIGKQYSYLSHLGRSNRRVAGQIAQVGREAPKFDLARQVGGRTNSTLCSKPLKSVNSNRTSPLPKLFVKGNIHLIGYGTDTALAGEKSPVIGSYRDDQSAFMVFTERNDLSVLTVMSGGDWGQTEQHGQTLDFLRFGGGQIVYF